MIAPGQTPIPIPENALPAEVGEEEQLIALPNPFMIGIAKPPRRVVRLTVTREQPLRLSHVVWRDNEGRMRDDVWKEHFIKTRPKSTEAWVMLVGGQMKDLPAPRDIAEARLCIPITNATPQALTMIGAALLNKPFESMRPYNLRNVGELIGTTIIPKYPKPADAKYYRIDITRAVKRIAAGDVFYGLALQTVPNRGIDDGWTTRIDIARDKRIYIEFDVYRK